MAVNDMIVHYPYPIVHAHSINRQMLQAWTETRRPKNKNLKKHCFRWPGVKSSGLNAVYCGLDLGYSEIVVCGVPLDNSGHYFDPPWLQTAFDRNAGHLSGCSFDENVYFMSGRASGERPVWLL